VSARHAANDPANRVDPAAAAAEYVERGWPVFPLHGLSDGSCTCGRTACSNPAKHPRTSRGFKDASTDREVVDRWWVQWPQANLGVRTGAVSGLLVVDVDAEAGGEQSLMQLEQTHGTLPATVAVLTGGGGKHLFFRHPGREVRNSAGKLGPGLDIRGDGGYVVAPPSAHASGNAYRWQEGRSPGEVLLAKPPGWLLAQLTAGSRKAHAASAAVVGEVIREGSRNATLTSLAGGMRQRGMSEHELLAELRVINEDRVEPPLPDSELAAIAASISRYPAGVAGTDRYKRTDYGNAERLVDRHGHELRFSPGSGWLVWDGRRWQRDSDGEPMRRMKETVRASWSEVANIDDRDERDARYRFLLRSESEPRLKAALRLAETETQVLAPATRLDADAFLLTVANGTVDLRTGELLEHRPSDLITKASPVAYPPTARSQLWEQFLERVTGGDTDLVRFLQRAVGYSLTGDTREEKLFFAHGPAASGKSTFLEALKGVFGDYATTADFETFLRKRGDGGIRNDIARLAGVRLVIGIEVDEGKRLAEGLVKSLTGGDTVTARFLYREHFEFQPQFKLWLAANDRPQVSATDSGIWRRIVQLPFTEAIPERERDPNVKLRLKGDPEVQQAILAWAVKGALAWHRDGLQIPARVSAYTEEYRQENDPLRDFFDDYCLFEDNARVTRSHLRKAYERWAASQLERPLSPKAFATLLKARGVTDGGKQRGERTWFGITLRDNDEPEPDGGNDPF
jgi:putative DNA primase/helicase